LTILEKKNIDLRDKLKVISAKDIEIKELGKSNDDLIDLFKEK